MKTITLTIALLGATFLLLLSGCATPQPISRLQPVQQQGITKWRYGSQLVTLAEQEGLEVAAAFRSSTPGYLVFDVKIRNASGRIVEIIPEQFYYEPLANDTATLIATKVFANDPEKMLLEFDKQESRMLATQQNETVSELLSITTNLVEDISTKNESTEELRQKYTERDARRAEYESSQANYQLNFNSLDAERSYWANQTIRRTTLDPGYEMTGTVFFLRNNKAQFIRLNVVIDNKIFPVTFWQILYKP